MPLPQTQLPIALHTPLNGDEHAPDVRAVAEHTALPALHTTMPDWAQPPLPLDVHTLPRTAQLVPHRLVPAGHTVLQKPAEQLCPDGHALPHTPQFSASLLVFTQVPAQSLRGAGQRHVPATHDWSFRHAVAQAPESSAAASRIDVVPSMETVSIAVASRLADASRAPPSRSRTGYGTLPAPQPDSATANPSHTA